MLTGAHNTEGEDARLLKASVNELNNLLQVIGESADALGVLCNRDADTQRHVIILKSGIERASRLAVSLGEKLGGFRSERPSPTSVAQIPVQPAPPPIVRQQMIDSDIVIQNPAGTKELVMVVDDEDLVSVLAQRMLADDGYRIILCKDGFAALRIYRKMRNEISLILLDYTMPVMDGADVFEELRDIDPNAPVVLTSGFTDQDRIRTMLSKGLLGFIPKPYTKEKLTTQVRNTIAAIQSERTGRQRIL